MRPVGRSGRRVAALALVLFAPPALAGEGDGRPTYRLAGVGFDLAPGDALRPKRAGALCLPRGSISWRESRPNPTEAIEQVAHGLRDGGLAVTMDGGGPDPGQPVLVVQAQVSALHLSACGPPGWPGRLVNRSRTTKGEGTITVRWSVTSMAEPRAMRIVATCRMFIYRGEDATYPDMVLAGLTQAAKAAAPELLSRQALPSEPKCPTRAEGERDGTGRQ